MIPATDGFGPWSDDTDAAERRACLRSLGSITRLYRGPRADRLADELHMAERDTGRVPAALAAFNALAPLDRRQELSSFARLHRPA